MRVVGLDGKNYNLNLGQYCRESAQSSGPHQECRQLLKKLFKMVQICEEVLLPGSGNLEADFYIPKYKLLIEVHGGQHYKPNKHFFSSMGDFKKAQTRDRKKRLWCELNDITYVELDSTNVNEWERTIKGFCWGSGSSTSEV